MRLGWDLTHYRPCLVARAATWGANASILAALLPGFRSLGLPCSYAVRIRAGRGILRRPGAGHPDVLWDADTKGLILPLRSRAQKSYHCQEKEKKEKGTRSKHG
jgi:hypothetical protein